MFFGLTNSPATFQTVINDILRDLVDTSSTANFIVTTNLEEEHDNIVQKLIKKIAKIDLYI